MGRENLIFTGCFLPITQLIYSNSKIKIKEICKLVGNYIPIQYDFNLMVRKNVDITIKYLPIECKYYIYGNKVYERKMYID